MLTSLREIKSPVTSVQAARATQKSGSNPNSPNSAATTTPSRRSKLCVNKRPRLYRKASKLKPRKNLETPIEKGFLAENSFLSFWDDKVQ